MTGTPHEHEHQREPGSGMPPLPGPAEETGPPPPMTIIGGPAAQDSPSWRADPAPPASYGSSQPAAYGTNAPALPPLHLNGFFSSVKRGGRWEVPPVIQLSQGFSEVAIDLREAIITSPVVEVRVYAGFSSCKIIIPPGVQVEWTGGTSLFSEEKADPPREQDPNMWRLKVTHNGAFNEVKVQTLGIGEKPPKWWKKLG
ncbi:hypothetical protein ACQBAT_12980 [Ornithinimicrobium sp. Y1847]|uniref:hypothetical protein n=1 Tax=Ornithinimicrobium sp. Y1847 TaxID=3405419 RepID=UPI003B67B8DE